MPETSAYTPTSIKELKAADPLDGLTLMQPPTANNSGTANLSYPIEIPAGRQGMQPNLALTYSSGGGNGWLGVGWDISIPSITVETRWGVPRYDRDKESEVYVYEGEQLVTMDGGGRFREMPHRTNQWTDRQDLDQDGHEQFYPRRNEAFDSIVRHGNGPDSYWWSVTHKNGVTDYYGKRHDADSTDYSGVLCNPATRNIAQWMLTESVDPFGNSVRYLYDVANNAGVAGSIVMGRQIYPSSIHYTNSSGKEGLYEVVFNRCNRREDVTISANRGLKEVTNAVLDNVEVLCNGQLLRTYYFHTTNTRNSSYKTRLEDMILVYGQCRLPSETVDLENGVKDSRTDFTFLETDSVIPCPSVRYSFEYFDYPDADSLFTGEVPITDLPDDNLQYKCVKNTFRSTALGATKGKSWSLGGTGAAGLGPDIATTLITLGANTSYSNSQSEGILTLIDLDGDGLADKVFKKNGLIQYRKRIQLDEHHFTYDSPVTVTGAADFLKESGSTLSLGLQASAGVSAGANTPLNWTTTTNYFADINGDGLVDLVTDRGVLFNMCADGGIPYFSSVNAIATTVPGQTGGSLTYISTQPDGTGNCNGIIFDGEVNPDIACVYGYSDILVPMSALENWLGDSCYAVVGYKLRDTIVGEGDYMFLRGEEDSAIVRNICDDAVDCTPETINPDLDAVRVWVAPYSGEIEIRSTIRLLMDSSESRAQSRYVDGVRYAIEHHTGCDLIGDGILGASDSQCFADTIGADNYIPKNNDFSIHVEEGDLLFFRLQSQNDRSFDRVEWTQQIEYFSIDNEEYGTDIYMLDNWMYNSDEEFVLTGRSEFQAPKDGTVDIVGDIETVEAGEYARISIRKNGHEEDSFELYPESYYQEPFQTQFHVDSMDRISVEIVRMSDSALNPYWANIHFRPVLSYHADNHPGDLFAMYDTLTCYPQVRMDIDHGGESALREHYHKLFGELYRGWGQFAYNNHGSPVVRDNCIELQSLQLPKIYTYNSPEEITYGDTAMYHSDTLVDSTDVYGSLTAALESSLYNPMSSNSRWVEMTAYGRDNVYRSVALNTAVSATGLDNTPPMFLIPVADSVPGSVDYSGTDVELEQIQVYDHPVPVSVQGGPVQSIRKRNRTKSLDASFSMDMVLASFGASGSVGSNFIQSDYMDMNGDGYPDPVATGGVQYTMPWGGIGTLKPIELTSGDHLSASDVLSYGGTYGRCYPTPNRLPGSNSKFSKMTVSAGGTTSESHVHSNDKNDYMLIDVNGDGLPDLVDALRYKTVRLNCGYGFLNGEIWNVGFIRNGQSTTDGSSMGGDFSVSQNALNQTLDKSYSVAQVSISGGTSQNQTRNKTIKQLMDINGDALPDKVEAGNNSISVRYNLGNGRWSQPEPISHVQISSGVSYNEDVNIGVTGGFTVCAVFKLNIGVQTSPKNHSFNTDCAQLVDVNGDGYPDYVTSDRESQMRVRYNRAGKTNLLKRVVNFTGSSIGLDYTLSKPCFDQPHRGWNLASVETQNNVGNCPVGGIRTLTTFEYGQPHHDRYERIGFGYDTVVTVEHNTEENDTVYRKTIVGYNNTNFFKRGWKTTETVLDGQDRPFVETIYNAMLFDLAGNMVSDSTCEVSGIYVGHEAETTNHYSCGNGTENKLTTAVSKVYDSRRNIKQYIYEGIRNSGYGEWFRAEIDYAQGLPHNMFSQPERIAVYNHLNNLMQLREAQYSASTGRLEQLRIYNSTSAASVYDFTYDTLGNLETVLMPQDDGGHRVQLEYGYDTLAHTWPAKVTNVSMGYTSSAEYDCRFGKPTRTVDINGNEIRYAYDSLGRTVRITAPNELADSVPYTIRMEYHPYFRGMTGQDVSYACTYHYDPEHPSDDIRTTLLADGLGRLLQTKKDAEIGGQERSLVTGRILYDCFGRTLRQYHPFDEDTSLYRTFSLDIDSNSATVTEYDILDRQTRVTVPYGYTTTMDYSIGSMGNSRCFVTNTTDAMGNTVTVKSGSLGQQLRQIMPGGVETGFEYDALGRLTKSVDPDNLATTYSYNMAGQMIHRKHPDAGDDWYGYDPMGNVIWHTNALGDTIKYRYFYGQLTDVEYPRYPANNVHYTYGDSTAGNNGKGRVVMQEDGSGWQTFKYGKLGEVTENIRTFALPFENRTYTFKMQYAYDSYNRIQTMTYPDGEMVHYRYNSGGMLERVYGTATRLHHDQTAPLQTQSLHQPDGIQWVPGDIVPPGPPPQQDPIYDYFTYPYIDSIAYNRFELKQAVFYGNGTRVSYSYDSLQRLQTLRSHIAQDSLMQDITYTYDSVGNITDIVNYATVLANGLGGKYWSHYDYDGLYRLSHAEGGWNGEQLNYHLDMQYRSNGRIRKKILYAEVMDHTGAVTVADYERNYQYHSAQPNTLKLVKDELTRQYQYFYWDAAGNMINHDNFEDNCTRDLYWDEGNRLMGFSDCHNVGLYQYDATGERTYKLTWYGTVQNLNGQQTVYYMPKGATLYASHYLVATPQGYTKHYYAETERITSQIGKGQLSGIGSPVVGDSLVQVKLQAVTANMEHSEDLTVLTSSHFAYLDTLTNRQDSNYAAYWYHPDHLGSSSWITYSDGSAVQHLHYLPWGEDFVDQRTTSWNAMFTFSAKEKDTETGFSYFGSRYYNSDLSIWLSVDPMSDKYPSLSPYVYCADNPVKLVDPNGEEIGDYYDLNGKWLGRDRNNDDLAYTATSVTKDADGYVVGAKNKSLLPISNSELLDRATWVCGESGGSNEMITNRVQNIGDASKTLDASVAEYYAAAINNIANASKGGFYEEIKIRMSRKGTNGNIVYTSSGYFTGQPGCGNSNSRAFAKARASEAESLNSQARFTNSIAAVIKSVSGVSDPTNGCRAWLGGDYAKSYVENADKIKTGAKVQFSFQSKGSFHTFYRY
ncbi:MAG: hypothetical protein IKP54_11145 [Bacteroidales bacterium]|nr:hypothetical protein [Bacteroidales bacterium]